MKIGSVLYGNTTIEYEISFSDRKTLQIAVQPDCKVSVIAPHDTDEEKIKEKVHKRARWVLKQQDFFQQFLPRTPPRQYCSGESHLYLGRRYRLKIEEGTQESVRLNSGKLIITCRDNLDHNQLEQLLLKWYRQKARILFQSRLLYHIEQHPEFRKYKATLQIRSMKKRWGSLSPKGILTLNLNLIKASLDCIDYVIIHELCHLIQHSHSPKFYRQLEKTMPDYKKRKLKLEKFLV
jgi:predicted metal-dependent hydrolase